MTTYFHVSSDNLLIGTLLEARYGKAIQQRRNHQASYIYVQYLRELILENYRTANFQLVPSRLNSIYLVDSLEIAEIYSAQHGKEYIYEVMIESEKPTLKADMKWLDKCKDQSIENLLKMANSYFSGESSGDSFWETLHEGPVIIVNEI